MRSSEQRADPVERAPPAPAHRLALFRAGQMLPVKVNRRLASVRVDARLDRRRALPVGGAPRQADMAARLHHTGCSASSLVWFSCLSSTRRYGHLVDTVNDLDNVLYEISNEDGPYSKDWQYHFIRYIHDQEKTRPKQHPVGMTAAGPSQEVMKPITSVKMDLTGAPGLSNAEWLDPRTGRIIPSGQVGGGSWIALFSPIEGEAILFLWKPKPSR